MLVGRHGQWFLHENVKALRDGVGEVTQRNAGGVVRITTSPCFSNHRLFVGVETEELAVWHVHLRRKIPLDSAMLFLHRFKSGTVVSTESVDGGAHRRAHRNRRGRLDGVVFSRMDGDDARKCRSGSRAGC